MDGVPFEGGSAKGVKLVLGSKRMIDGFEAGLIGAGNGDEKQLKLTFPADYQKADLAGKAVEFAVKVNQISEVQLPELNDDFFVSFDVSEGGLEAFRSEVKSNMARELKNAIRNNVRNQIVDGLVKAHSIEVPKALIAGEVNTLRQQAIQQYGGNSQKIDESMLPAELFKDQAVRRVSLGLIMNEVIQQSKIKVEPETIRKLVDELAESYEKPEEVVSWYYSNKEQLAQVEAMALEEAVIDQVLAVASTTEVNCSYEDALKPSTPEASEA